MQQVGLPQLNGQYYLRSGSGNSGCVFLKYPLVRVADKDSEPRRWSTETLQRVVSQSNKPLFFRLKRNSRSTEALRRQESKIISWFEKFCPDYPFFLITGGTKPALSEPKHCGLAATAGGRPTIGHKRIVVVILMASTCALGY